MKKYSIPNGLAPNITKQKTKGALKFMFHRYQSGVTGESQVLVYSYAELIIIITNIFKVLMVGEKWFWNPLVTMWI